MPSALYTTNEGVFRIYPLADEWVIELEGCHWSFRKDEFSGTEEKLMLLAADLPEQLYPWTYDRAIGYICGEAMRVEVHPRLEAQLLRVHQPVVGSNFIELEGGLKIHLSSRNENSSWSGPSKILLTKDGVLLFLKIEESSSEGTGTIDMDWDSHTSNHVFIQNKKTELKEEGWFVFNESVINQKTGKFEPQTKRVQYRLLS